MIQWRAPSTDISSCWLRQAQMISGDSVHNCQSEHGSLACYRASNPATPAVQAVRIHGSDLKLHKLETLSGLKTNTANATIFAFQSAREINNYTQCR